MPSDQYIQAVCEILRESIDVVENALLQAGAISVTLQDGADQPILEPRLGENPLWDKCIVKALFAADIDTDSACAFISDRLTFSISIHWELLEDRDWSQEWKKYFKPIPCKAGRLWICPSWAKPPNTNAINLHMDPGLAFGTGSHPTTMLCLNWLEMQSLEGKIVVDYGCGSGILGIAALLLGATKVFAIDNDPQALLATRNNAQRNGIDEAKLITLLPDQIPDNTQANVVLANILANPLIELKDTISAMTVPAGQLCLSGILIHQTEQITSAYSHYFDFEATNIDDNWVQMGARKTG